MIVNGGFEVAGASNGEAANWDSRDLLNGDKRRCDKPDKGKFFSYDGECAFRFKVNVTDIFATRVIRQTIDDPALAPDMTVDLGAFISATNLTGLPEIVVVIKYTDGTRDKYKFELPTGTYDWQQVSEQFVVAKPVKNARISVSLENSGGEFFIDSITMSGQILPSGLPLPAAPQD